MSTDVVDYQIKGSETQFVEVALDPGETAFGEVGSLMTRDAGLHIDTLFGDGRHSAGRVFFGTLVGAGTRLVTGESLFTTVYTNIGAGKRRQAAASARKPCCSAGWRTARCSLACWGATMSQHTTCRGWT